MPAHARYPSPHNQLLELALAAKRRGLSFEEFWREAVRPRACKDCGRETIRIDCPECGGKTTGPAPLIVSGSERPPGAVLWPTDTKDRRTWLGAVDESKDGWRRAYEGAEAPRREHALVRLSPMFEAMDRIAAERAEEELNGAPA